MTTKRFYVSVQANSILEEQGAADFEFEILANQQDLEELERLFQVREENEINNFVTAYIPGVPYHTLDESNDAYDRSLVKIYEKIHELGTDDTKQLIEEMGVLRQGIAHQK